MTREEAIRIIEDARAVVLCNGEYDKAMSMAIEALNAEPVTQTIEKFRDYQIEWLTSHNDIEFCEEDERLIVQFLQDTAECFLKEVEE